MCFSATASFAAGAVLVTTGILAIRKVKKPSQYAVAAIPFIFGIQQISEGFVWISLQHPAYLTWHMPATYFFLAFAQVVWPAWVPFSFLLMEKEKRHRNILFGLMGLGLLVSVYLAVRIVTTGSVNSYIDGMHISYDLGIEVPLVRMLGILYFVVTVIPSFFSTKRHMWILGVLTLTSYFVTKLFFENYVISVWCFFAALISVAVFFVITEPEKQVNAA